jgi:uncharacterized membrane protein
MCVATRRRMDDERASERPSLEERIGKRWSTWAGAAAILCAAGYYLQLASGRGWLGPWGKIGIAIAGGLLACVLGDRALRKDARVLGQGLLGAGLGVVFGALYAGHELYGLYEHGVAGGALVVVTALGMLVAVRRDAAPVAVLAVLGGYLTPVLASRGGDASESRDALFAYLMVLDLGVLGVALARRWRALEWLALAGTWVLFAGWYHRSADPGAGVTMAWCAGFYAVFLAVPLGFHLRRGLALSRERLAMVVLDAALAFGFACEILDGDGTQLAVVALVMAAVHVVLAAVVARRLRGDGVAYSAFAVLAAGFATLAAPLALRDEGVSLAWALEAPVLAWLGARYRVGLVRWAGAAVLLAAGARLLMTHLPLHVDDFTPFANARFASAFAVAAAAGAYAWVARRAALRAGDRFGAALAAGAGIGGALLGVGLVNAELWTTRTHVGDLNGALFLVLAWWLAVTGALLEAARRTSRGFAVGAWLAALATAMVASVIAIAAAFAPPSSLLLLANPRFVLLSGATLAWLALWHVERRLPGSLDPSLVEVRRTFASAVPSLVVGALLFIVSQEAWQQARLDILDPERARWFGLAALSCAWSVFAAAALAIGLRIHARSLRIFALALFGVTIAKVLLVDLAAVEQMYRVASLLVLGVFLFAASWLYHRAT